jgi:hypothetical protein
VQASFQDTRLGSGGNGDTIEIVGFSPMTAYHTLSLYRQMQIGICPETRLGLSVNKGFRQSAIVACITIYYIEG